MTDRIFEDQISFEVTNGQAGVEFYIYEDCTVKINVTEGSGHPFALRHASFNMTAEEATRLKEFLIWKGY